VRAELCPWRPLDGIPPAWRIAVLAAAFGIPAALLLARPSGSTAAARACAGILMALFGAAVLAVPLLAGIPLSQALWLAAGALWTWTAVRSDA
jgi:hypothetical protein